MWRASVCVCGVHKCGKIGFHKLSKRVYTDDGFLTVTWLSWQTCWHLAHTVPTLNIQEVKLQEYSSEPRSRNWNCIWYCLKKNRSITLKEIHWRSKSKHKMVNKHHWYHPYFLHVWIFVHIHAYTYTHKHKAVKKNATTCCSFTWIFPSAPIATSGGMITGRA